MNHDEDAVRAQSERIASLTGVSPECMFEVAKALQGMGLTANHIPLSKERNEALTLKELRAPVTTNDFRLCKYFDLQMLCLSLACEAKRRNGLTPGIVAELVEGKVQNTLDSVGQCRIACFSRSPYNLYMWAHYANDHTEFCVEYETNPNVLKARGFDEGWLGFLLRNMFNVFYCPDRPNATDEIITFMRHCLDDEGLARFYSKILCFKSPDWTFEHSCVV